LASLIARKFLGVCGQPDTAAVFSDYRNSPNQHVDHVDAFTAANRTYYLPAARLASAEDEDAYEEARDAASKAVGFALPSFTKAAARHCCAASPMGMTGWNGRGMVHETRADNRQAADCCRKVIDFIRHHPDCYDTRMVSWLTGPIRSPPQRQPIARTE
jgi:hypothetical protein